MTPLVVIPARWGSHRLPGKPLSIVAGQPLLTRVVDLVRRATRDLSAVDLVVAVDDERVAALALTSGCEVVWTSPKIGSGSARALAAAESRTPLPNHVINVQGDAPFLPQQAIRGVIQALLAGADVATPVARLTWAELDALREHKQHSPFSGTTSVVAPNGDALWFSKQIIPAIRDEEPQRERSPLSPVLQHFGLYGYTLQALRRFNATPVGYYERLEGLEQLRFLDLGLTMRTVDAGPRAITMSGIDTVEDVRRAERLIKKHGDPFGT